MSVFDHRDGCSRRVVLSATGTKGMEGADQGRRPRPLQPVFRFLAGFAAFGAATCLCFSTQPTYAQNRLPGASQEFEPVTEETVRELEADFERYSRAVRSYRSSANKVIRYTYEGKRNAIQGKYEPLIQATEDEERNRRLEAIAMFEAFLRKYPSDPDWSPDAMFRLAELYFERSAERFLTAQDDYQDALDRGEDPPEPPTFADYGASIELYRRLLTSFPSYRFGDAAMYLLGYCLAEMAQEPEAKQALLGLTCANKFRPLDPPNFSGPYAGLLPSQPLPDPYETCEPVVVASEFLPEGWTRLGEMHFDSAELPEAIGAYRQVVKFEDSPYFDKALYKLAWSFYRDNRFEDAINEFDRLVVWADAQQELGDENAGDLRPEAVQYLAISFSEPDWDGDTLPDLGAGLDRFKAFYQGRNDEKHVKEVALAFADILFDTTKYDEAITAYKYILETWPLFLDAPSVQEKIIQAHERNRNLDAAATERERLGTLYGPGSEWYEHNKDEPEATQLADRLAEEALLMSATNVHAQAQGCRAQSADNPGDNAKADECLGLYASAADLYERYLSTYPNSKRAYEFSAFYADTLFYSRQFEKAIAAYTDVRGSDLDNKYQEDAAFRIIKAYEEIIGAAIASGALADPPIPTEANTKPPVQSMDIADVYLRYLKAIDWYTGKIVSDQVPAFRYAAAVLLLRHRFWPEARARLSQITDLYCGTNPEIGFQAYDAILATYLIDFQIEDEKEKDCALGRLLTVTEAFADSACGRSPQAADHLARINRLKASVKSTVITKRLELALENEENGTDRQLVQCEEGGGIALVMGTGGDSGRAGAGTEGGTDASGKPARSKLSTEVDEGLALDLMDLVASDPQSADAPNNLNNACVIYERIYKFGEATRCYERLANEYPDSPLALEAVWNAARNHYRFFEFDEAVAGYLEVAESPKFEGYVHREEALGIAATLLDNDQQYQKSADLYLRYSNVIRKKTGDAAQAHFFACRALEKAKRTRTQSSCLRDLIKRFDNQAEAGSFVVEAYLKLAELAEASGNSKRTFKAYRQVRDEFKKRQLSPATPAAAAAAKADFLVVEEQFKTFQKKKLNFGSKPERIRKVFDQFTAEAKALSGEYQKVWAYKDATWTLAAFLRVATSIMNSPKSSSRQRTICPQNSRSWKNAPARRTPKTAGWSKRNTRTRFSNL